ncbi:MAG TPA: hypothetical protein VG165_11235 [Solirubrobacteraceae bacterium]|jgi:hypothetical protein|nr:hypothetical protein [Solirubrobacteraceae bacterium]
MERRSVVAGGRDSRRRARRVLGGLLGCICAALLAPVQSALALTVTGGTVSAVEGAAFKGQVATFSDLTGLTGCQAVSSYASSVSWSDDRTTSSATVGAPAANGLTCVYPVSAQHRFAEVGNSLPFTISVTGPFGGSGTATGSANITAAPLSSQALGVTAVEGEPFTATLANFTDGFTGRPPSHYTASVEWGDGSTTAPATVVQAADGSFDVDATHTYANVGTYTTTVSITEPEGSRTTALGSSAVADAPLSSVGVANTAIEGDSFAAALATFTDADPGRPAGYYTATVDWGDGSTSTPTIVADPAGGFDVVAGHTYADPGSYTTTVTIADPDGAQTTAAAHLTVADAPLSSTGIPITAGAGTPVTAALASFTDANTGRAAGYYSATVDWGDGSTSAAAIVADPAGGFEVIGTHTYVTGGSFPTLATISDPGGSTTLAPSTATVAAPPPPPPPPTPTPTPTVVTTPTPAATVVPPKPTVLPTPKVSLTSPRLSASRTSISITVTCPTGGGSCQGVVRLTTLPASGSKVAALRRGTTLGSVLFVLHPGQAETFSIHIASQALRLLRQAGTARVQGVAVAFGKLGNATSSGAVAKIAAVKAPATAKSKAKAKAK